MPAIHPALAALLSPLLAAAAPQQHAFELREEGSFLVGGGGVFAVDFSADGQLLASAGQHGDMVVREVPTGRERARFVAAGRWIGAVKFTPDGDRLAVVADDLALWDWRAGKRLAGAPTGSAHALAFAAGGRLLAHPLDGAVVVSGPDLGEVG